jgi:protein-tyrosine phosphatase
LIDLHCHILPGLDDGSRNLEESLAMARLAAGDGIRTIVASPHTLNGVYLNRASEVRAGVSRLQEEMKENEIKVKVCEGADIHLCPRILDYIKRGEAGTINGKGKYILLELPSQTVPPGTREEIFSLKLGGITPIITHPERHPGLHADPALLQEIVRAGALCQITAMSITGEFGEPVKRFSEMLLTRRLAHVIASDAHSTNDRPPLLSAAVVAGAEVLGSYDEAVAMVTRVPESILAGETVDVPEP